MTAKITELIDWGVRGDELARDEIAAILAVETAGQGELANSQQNPQGWSLDVYSERSEPWNRWQDLDESALNALSTYVPLVNVQLAGLDIDTSKTTSVRPSRGTAIIHLDCYGFGCAGSAARGHEVADKLAKRNAMRGASLVFGILFSEHYTYLGSPSKIPDKWCFGRSHKGEDHLSPDFAANATQAVRAIRMRVNVEVSLRVPIIEGQALETVSATVDRDDDGKILLRADYSLT